MSSSPEGWLSMKETNSVRAIKNEYGQIGNSFLESARFEYS